MLINVPAVASTSGTASSVTWRSDGIYSYTGKLRIPGSYTSGTFTNAETVTQQGSGATGVISGNQSSGLYLLVTTGVGVSNDSGKWVGGSSGAVFQPVGKWNFPPTLWLYEAIVSREAFSFNAASNRFSLVETAATTVKLALDRNPRQGSTLKYLDCVLPSFTVPVWAKSVSLKNISGAIMCFRPYLPNVSANVIDTTTGTLSDTTIVGQELVDEQLVGISNGDFTPGASYMVVADAAVTSGAIVIFHP